jgi:acetoacetyl-CoA synthetase
VVRASRLTNAMSDAEPLWRPTRPSGPSSARITAFRAWLARERGLAFVDYESMWRWSVTDLEGFWSAVWQFFGVQRVGAVRAGAGRARDARNPVVSR